MAGPFEYPRGPVKLDSLKTKRAKADELWLPNVSGTLTKLTVDATDLNGLGVTTRRFTIYSVGALAVGDLLHISSYEAVNDVFVVEKADADTTGKPAQLIASEINSGNETSTASDIEELTGLNTNAGEVGDPVYLSAATAGSWTLTAPTGADQIQQIVGRIKVKSATVGKIMFNTVKADTVKIGTSGLQDSSVTSAKIAPGTVVLSDIAPDVARKFTVYSAVALAIGELLHISSYDASDDVFTVEKADADTSGKPAQLIASATNAGTTTSEARDILTLDSLNTNAGTVGDPVYLDATTAGGWTLTGPTGADQLQQIVGRIKVKSTTVGEIVFNTVNADMVKIGTSGLQDSSVTSAKIAAGTVVMSDIAADVARKFTVYSAVALAIGELLHISSYDASDDVFTVEKADADTSGKPAQLIASAINAGTTTSEARDILTLGSLNTNAGTVGDPVYLDATTAGGWTLTGPTGADQLQQIVGRIKVKSTTVGEIAFNTVSPEVVKIGTSGLQDSSVTSAKIAPGTVILSDMAADVARKFTVYSVGALAVGELLHISSYNAANDVFIVEKADADTSGKPAQLIASAINAGTTTSEARDILTLGTIDTDAGTVGDPVYLDATTAGGWTLTAPTGADQIAQIVGRIKVKSATVGEIVFNTVNADMVKIGTSGLQDSSVTSAKIAAGTVVMSDIAADVARKFTVYSVASLAVGELLHISGYNVANDVFIVQKADADTSDKPAQLIASAINAGTTTSEARDLLTVGTINTNAGNVGDPVYLDATTAGGWTLTAPTGADQIKQIVGRVRVKSEAAGEIVFNTVSPELVSVGSSALQPDSVTKTKLAGGFSKVTLVAGTDSAADVTIADMAVGDEVVAVLSFVTAANIATVADRTAEYTAGAGVLTKAAGTDDRNNQLLVVWTDIT